VTGESDALPWAKLTHGVGLSTSTGSSAWHDPQSS
jgi:hypothetical protein